MPNAEQALPAFHILSWKEICFAGAKVELNGSFI